MEILAPVSKTTDLDMLRTGRLQIEHDLIILPCGSIRIHVHNVGDVPKGRGGQTFPKTMGFIEGTLDG